MRVRPACRVIQLRPRAITRRSTLLRGRILARRSVSTVAVSRLLDIVTGVLARADQVRSSDLGAWDRLLTLLEELEHTVQATPACAAAANLVGLALFDEPADHRALTELTEQLGHSEVARLQHRYGAQLEPNPGLPIASAAVRRLLVGGHLRAAHALLSQGIDLTWTVPALESSEELLDMAERGTIVEWRHHLAMVVAAPWAPSTTRLVELAHASGDSCGGPYVVALIELCRDQADRSP